MIKIEPLPGITIDIKLDGIPTESTNKTTTSVASSSSLPLLDINYGSIAVGQGGGSSGGDGESATSNIRYGIQSITNTLTAGVGLLQEGLKQEAKTATKGSAKATEIAEATADLAKSTKFIKIAGKALGITSAIQHGYKLGVDYQNGDWTGVAINGGKLILDGVFFFGKSTNPAFLGASIAYGVADYMTNDY